MIYSIIIIIIIIVIIIYCNNSYVVITITTFTLASCDDDLGTRKGKSCPCNAEQH